MMNVLAIEDGGWGWISKSYLKEQSMVARDRHWENDCSFLTWEKAWEWFWV